MTTRAEQGSWFDGLIGDRQTDPKKIASLKVGLSHLHESLIHGDEAKSHHGLSPEEAQLFITVGRALTADYEDLVEQMQADHRGSSPHTYYESRS